MAATDESGKPLDRFSESCVLRVGKAVTIGAVAGAMTGASMLAWYPDPYVFDSKGRQFDANIGFRYALRHLKAPVVYSAVVCGVFAGVDCLMEQMRDEAKESTYVNSALAGAAAGLVMGGLSKRMDIMATSALGVGMLMGMVEFNGQSAVGSRQGPQSIGKDSPQETNLAAVNELKEKYPEFKHL